ncbi:hypothetical protein [Obesumbacterium proteus]|uniref:hypothetical protein n=1 Tax=Obesumbacterium proteus TaxID=82983 RepID=UPI002430A6C8|nr:hypothetical protein [Obesumbacterium proteus]
MSMTIINNKPSITEMQLHAMLTGDVKGATKLDGWDAFKNFFIKLLNHLPGISLEDKEVALHGIYNQIYGTESPSVFDENTKSIEPVWNALDKLIHMMEKDKVQTMTFAIQCSDHPNGVHQSHQPSDILLKITIDGHSLADISCSHTPLNNDMLCSILKHYMTKTDDSEGTLREVYQFNPDILNTEENGVSFNLVTKTANSNSFSVAKKMDECRSFLAEDIHGKIKTETRFTNEVEQIERNTQLVSELETLKNTQHDDLINETITQLNNRLFEQQTVYKEINHNFVESMVQKWATKLEQSQPLLKTEINEDINRITKIDSRSLDLFTEADRGYLRQLPEQLRIVYQIAELEAQRKDPTEFTQEYFLALTKILIDTPSGPLIKVLMSHSQRIFENKTRREYQENTDKQNLQMLTKKIDNWTARINSQPMAGQYSEALPKASTSNATPNQSEPTITSQLASFKNEISQQNLTQEHKTLLLDKIDKLIIQHETIKSIENKINSYESQNKKATNEDLKILVDEKESLMACARRSDIDLRISALIAKNIQFDEISADLVSVRNGIASVNKNLAIYSDALENRLVKIEERANALPLAEDDKTPILTNIAAAKQELAKIQQRDEIYAQVRTLLGPDTPSISTPSSNWEMALSQLKLAATSLKTLPDSPRKSQLTKNFSEDVKSALIMLADFCTQSPTGQEKTDYMKDREKDYILLRDLVRSNKLPNNAELEENITLIKHENKFKSTPFIQKILG